MKNKMNESTNYFFKVNLNSFVLQDKNFICFDKLLNALIPKQHVLLVGCQMRLWLMKIRFSPSTEATYLGTYFMQLVTQGDVFH